MGIFLNIAF